MSATPTVPTPDEASRIWVLSGPTAVGKGTLVTWIRARYPDLFYSVSATTRPRRPGEVHGVHYLFGDDAAFDALTERGELLEWALVHGRHRYGTPRGPVLEAVRAGRTALLELDIAGARQIRAVWPQVGFVFLAPPSFGELSRRLSARGTEDSAQQQRRLATARVELDEMPLYPHVLVNRDVEQAATGLVRLLGLSG